MTAEKYLKDGEKSAFVQVLVSRARRYLPDIESDLETIEKLVETYERSKVWQPWRGRVVEQWLEEEGPTPWAKVVDGKYQ